MPKSPDKGNAKQLDTAEKCETPVKSANGKRKSEGGEEAEKGAEREEEDKKEEEEVEEQEEAPAPSKRLRRLAKKVAVEDRCVFSTDVPRQLEIILYFVYKQMYEKKSDHIRVRC